MPVSVESQEWRNAEKENSTRESILNFLSNHPDQAFTIDELTDEILGMNLELKIPEEELGLGELIGEGIVESRDKAHAEAFMTSHVSALVYSGDVEVREIKMEVDDSEVSIPHYTINS